MRDDRFDAFERRHIGPRDADITDMLRVVGASSLEALVDEVVPPAIRTDHPLNLAPVLPEHDYLQAVAAIAGKNRVFRSFIGLGYSDTITPPVILRNIMENPGWYTPYTPYQAEIAQGRLESLLNFQTMVKDLTGMEVAGASLLDEATAAGEAMTLLHRVQSKRVDALDGTPQFFVADTCFPQTIDVLTARAEPLGVELVVGSMETAQFGDRVFGALVQSPDEAGVVHDLR